MREDGKLDRTDVLLRETYKFFEAMGLHKGLMNEIYKARSDWEFILKIDALLEAATKQIIKSALKLKIGNTFGGAEALSEFVDGLPMNGKTSLMHLLKACGCPLNQCDFIEAVRRVRNSYAHNIKQADLPLIELIKQRRDRSHTIKNICDIENYVEGDLIEQFENDGQFFRFCIVDATMQILIAAYHVALK
ncbi:MAG: hypothetical protein AB1508_13285 [Pseudomonadota bacterium]